MLNSTGLSFKITNNIALNTRKVGKSANKLSTGLNINNASDNSAGMAISKK